MTSDFHFIRTLIPNKIKHMAIRLREMTTVNLEKVFRLNPSMPPCYRITFGDGRRDADQAELDRIFPEAT